MNVSDRISVCLGAALAVMAAVPALGQETGESAFAWPIVTPDLITFQVEAEVDGLRLRVSGAQGLRYEADFSGHGAPYIELFAPDGQLLTDGPYRFELVGAPKLTEAARQALHRARAADDDLYQALKAQFGLDRPPTLAGGFIIANGQFAILDPMAAGAQDTDEPPTEQFINQDLMVKGELCAGADCTSTEAFGTDTLRLKANNLRVHINDTSTSPNYPANNWRLIFNDSTFNGDSYVALEDTTAGNIPVRVEAGAGANALFVADGGNVGLGTDDPILDIHIRNSDTPSLRLEQDDSIGFLAQTWDIVANEAHIGFKDVTNSNTQPFRVRAGAPDLALYVNVNGTLGLGHNAPSGGIHMVRNDGLAKVILDEQSATAAAREMIDLKNKGPIRIGMENTDSSYTWTTSNDALGYAVQRSGNAGETLLLSNSNRVLVRPAGAGNEIFTLEANGNLTIAGTLTQNSNRDLKTDFRPVDSEAVLEKALSLPLSEWRYKDEESGARHFGPMAQDFADLFGWGEDREHIAVIDMAGVALASIQGLHDRLSQKQAALDRKIQEIHALRSELQAQRAEFQNRLDALERLASGLSNQTPK